MATTRSSPQKDCYLHVTRLCNQQCVFCSTPPKNIELSLHELKERVLFAANHGATQIVFSGGEPTTFPHLAELMAFSTSAGITCKIISNGHALSKKDYALELHAAGLKRACISFHSSNSENFAEMTKNPSSLTAAANAIENLRSIEGMETDASIVVNSLNFRQLPETAKFLSERFPSLHLISINFVDAVGLAKNNREIVPKISQSLPFMLGAFQEFKNKSMPFHVERVPPCLLGEFRENSSELIAAKNNAHPILFPLSENASELRDYSEMLGKAYVKSEACESCNLSTLCPGLARGYSELYGFEELAPIRGKEKGLAGES